MEIGEGMKYEVMSRRKCDKVRKGSVVTIDRERDWRKRRKKKRERRRIKRMDGQVSWVCNVCQKETG